VLLLGLRETWVLQQHGCLQLPHACCCCWCLGVWQAESGRLAPLARLLLLLLHHLALASCCCCTRCPILQG
jgi:hypothetical protein